METHPAFPFETVMWGGTGTMAAFIVIVAIRCKTGDRWRTRPREKPCIFRTWVLCTMLLCGIVAFAYGAAGILVYTPMGDFLRNDNATKFERFVLDAAHIVTVSGNTSIGS